MDDPKAHWWTIHWELEKAHGTTTCVVKHSSSPVFWHQVSTVVLLGLIYEFIIVSLCWWLVPFLLIWFKRNALFLLHMCSNHIFQSHWTTWVHKCHCLWNMYIQVFKPTVWLGVLPARWSWLLSIYMDHGDIQKKNAFIFIEYFIELYKMGINKCIYSKISFSFA